jgi:hypothetical protein
MSDESSTCPFHRIDVTVQDRDHMVSAGCPHGGVGRAEPGDHRRANRGSKVCYAGIVPYVEACLRKPAGKIIEVWNPVFSIQFDTPLDG